MHNQIDETKEEEAKSKEEELSVIFCLSVMLIYVRFTIMYA